MKRAVIYDSYTFLGWCWPEEKCSLVLVDGRLQPSLFIYNSCVWLELIFIFVILYFYPFLIQILKLTWFQIEGSCFRLGKAHRWCNLHFTCPPRGRHTDYHKFGNKIFGLCGCDMLWLTNLAAILGQLGLVNISVLNMVYIVGSRGASQLGGIF